MEIESVNLAHEDQHTRKELNTFDSNEIHSLESSELIVTVNPNEVNLLMKEKNLLKTVKFKDEFNQSNLKLALASKSDEYAVSFESNKLCVDSSSRRPSKSSNKGKIKPLKISTKRLESCSLLNVNKSNKWENESFELKKFSRENIFTPNKSFVENKLSEKYLFHSNVSSDPKQAEIDEILKNFIERNQLQQKHHPDDFCHMCNKRSSFIFMIGESIKYKYNNYFDEEIELNEFVPKLICLECKIHLDKYHDGSLSIFKKKYYDDIVLKSNKLVNHNKTQFFSNNSNLISYTDNNEEFQGQRLDLSYQDYIKNLIEKSREYKINIKSKRYL